MFCLRHLTACARFVLAWFVLSVGIATAAPAVKPQVLEMVCAGGVMKLQVLGEEGAAGSLPSLDCPLCAPFHGPPVSAASSIERMTLGQAQPGVVSLPPLCRACAAPLPARGPPAAPASA